MACYKLANSTSLKLFNLVKLFHRNHFKAFNYNCKNAKFSSFYCSRKLQIVNHNKVLFQRFHVSKGLFILQFVRNKLYYQIYFRIEL